MEEAKSDLPPGPSVGIDHAMINGKVHVRERIVSERPFGRLLHFEITPARPRPPVLLVAPLSGVRAELLYDMIVGMLPCHDVYCLAWRDAADVPAADGPFRLEDNIGYVVEMIRQLAPEPM